MPISFNDRLVIHLRDPSIGPPLIIETQNAHATFGSSLWHFRYGPMGPSGATSSHRDQWFLGGQRVPKGSDGS